MHKYTMFAADCGKVIRSKLWLKFSEKVIKVSTLAPSFGETSTFEGWLARSPAKPCLHSKTKTTTMLEKLEGQLDMSLASNPTNRQSWKTTWQCHSLQALVEANTKTSRCEDWLAKFWRLQAVPNLKLENQMTMFADCLECHLLEALVEILKQPMSEDHLAVSLAPSQTLV